MHMNDYPETSAFPPSSNWNVCVTKFCSSEREMHAWFRCSHLLVWRTAIICFQKNNNYGKVKKLSLFHIEPIFSFSQPVMFTTMKAKSLPFYKLWHICHGEAPAVALSWLYRTFDSTVNQISSNTVCFAGPVNEIYSVHTYVSWRLKQRGKFPLGKQNAASRGGGEGGGGKSWIIQVHF